MWGLYWDGASDNSIFYSWEGDEIPEAGTTFNLSAYFMSHNADFIGQGNSHGMLVAKYFGDGPNDDGSNWWEELLVQDESAHFNASTATADQWDNYTLTSSVPELSLIHI